ncbi:MAG: aspartate/glutamate racemase family protein [Hyphomicrobiaceae bacterium]
MSPPRIALIHATPVAISPIGEAFKMSWPEAELMNILDDSLSVDRSKTPNLTNEMFSRFEALSQYALMSNADAILFTCSAFGEAIEAVAKRTDRPVLKPNEAMFEAALAIGTRIAMIATFAPSVASMEDEFANQARELNCPASISTVLVESAMDALRQNDTEMHNRLVADAAESLLSAEAVMLAQFSTARAARAVRERTDVPVLTSPDAAIAKLKNLLLTR